MNASTETKQTPDPDLPQAIETALAELQARVSDACRLIKRHGLAGKPKRRRQLSTLNWAAIRYLLVVERWPATKIAEHFDVAPKSILMRNKRYRWTYDGPRAAPDPELTTADILISRSLMDALALYHLPPVKS